MRFLKALKKKLSGRLKTLLLDVIKRLKEGKMSEKSVGVIVRSVHMSAPGTFLAIMVAGSQSMCVLTMAFIAVVATMFYTFDGCFLSILEKELCGDDFTIIDPYLELLDLEITNANRMYVSSLVGLQYIMLVCFIYGVRF